MPRRKTYTLFFLLIAPAVLLRLVTSLYPIVHTAYLSLFDINVVMGRHRFAGLWNYADMWYDQAITGSITFTLIFVGVSTALEIVLGFAVALLLNARLRGRGLVRTISLIPWAIPTIVAAIGFRWLLDDQYGMLVDIFNRLTGERPALLVDPWGARWAVIGTNVWKNTPFLAIVILAGLQSVPAEVYEAARIDGAGPLQSLRHITIPLCAGLVTTLGVFFVIWQLGSFDLVYGMTQGGPGTATSVISYRILQLGFLWFNYGMASALSIVLFLLVTAIGAMGLILVRRQQVSF